MASSRSRSTPGAGVDVPERAAVDPCACRSRHPLHRRGARRGDRARSRPTRRSPVTSCCRRCTRRVPRSAPMRLVDMGVEPYLVARRSRSWPRNGSPASSATTARRRWPSRSRAAAQARRGSTRCSTVRRCSQAVGCPMCRNTGYRGRLPAVRDHADHGGHQPAHRGPLPSADIEHLAVEEGMEAMRSVALRRVANGTLSIDEMVLVPSRERDEVGQGRDSTVSPVTPV